MMRKVCFAVLLILLVHTICAAQERPTAGGVFYWFPDGTYKTLAYADLGTLRASNSYSYYSRMYSDTGEYLTRSWNPLPDEAKQQLTKIAFGHLVVYKDNLTPLDTLENEAQLALLEDKEEQLSVDDSGRLAVRDSVDAGAMFWVFGFEDTVNIVREGLKAGWLTRPGLRMTSRPVFRLCGSGGNESKSFYAYATTSNELLVANEFLTLTRMIRTGHSADPGLLDNPDYALLFHIIPELGQSWSIAPKTLHDQAVLEQLNRAGGPEKNIKNLEARIESGPLFEIASNEFAEDSTTETTIRIYGSDESAAADASRLKAEMDEERWGFLSNLNEARTLSGSEESEQRRKLIRRAAERLSGLTESFKTSVEGNVVRTVFTINKRELGALRYLTDIVIGRTWK
ncbi:MAG TPA: hypothetical protein VMX35_13610 [Acidobacteriota bacterium]|nr:hypothetical protein [Acidobacteriota bacterium]